MRQLLVLPLVIAVLGVGCGSASRSDSQYWQPSGLPAAPSGTVSDSGTPPPEGGSGGGGPTNPYGTVTFTATPVSYGGRYRPRDVGVIWIEDANAQFVKTLIRWGYIRWVNLSKWRADSGSNMVDAVTAATASSAKPHSGTWDYTDVSGNVVPDGEYHFLIEFAEDNARRSSSSNGPSTAVPFQKGAGATDFNPPDVSGFTAMSVTYQAP